MKNCQIMYPNVIYPGQVIFIPSKFCPTLRLGNQGPSVIRLQIILQFLGTYTGRVDGIFGPMTLDALKDWQSSVKEIEVTGIADTDT